MKKKFWKNTAVKFRTTHLGHVASSQFARQVRSEQSGDRLLDGRIIGGGLFCQQEAAQSGYRA